MDRFETRTAEANAISEKRHDAFLKMMADRDRYRTKYESALTLADALVEALEKIRQHQRWASDSTTAEMSSTYKIASAALTAYRDAVRDTDV